MKCVARWTCWKKRGASGVSRAKGPLSARLHPLNRWPFRGLVQQTNLLEVMEARLQLEPGLARLAALRATGENLALMQRMLERIDKVSPDDRDLNELWDSAFHRAIAEAAGNRLMLGLFDAIDAVRREPGWQHLRELARTPSVSIAITTTITRSWLPLSIASLTRPRPRCANTCLACKPP